MNMYDLIVKKKRGGALAKDEIDWMIREYTDGRIPDYQMSAMMMAVCFVGMTDEETKDLTLAMATCPACCISRRPCGKNVGERAGAHRRNDR